MNADAPPLLRAENLVAGYEPGLAIVDGASLAVGGGELLAVLGPNGAGKSTFIKAIAGMVPVFAGRVAIGGVDITDLPAHRRLAHGLAFVPQTENIFQTLTVADNLRLAADRLPDAKAAGRQVEAMFETFPDLARQKKLLAGRLSGGQRQMLAIARALITRPSVLMLDEPSAGLSPKLVDLVFTRIAALRATGVAILLVEQNTRAALRIADRALVLVEGRNRHEGPARALATDPGLAELYLGSRQGAAPSALT
jgi:branched-chain amino acid transport system ATP-binding protein